MIVCPKCNSPKTKCYGNSRAINADCTLFRYIECRVCHMRWRHQESRHIDKIPGFPRPKQGEIVYIARRKLDIPGFWIAAEAYTRPNIVIQNRLLSPGDYVALVPLQPNEGYEYVKHFAYTCVLENTGYRKSRDGDPYLIGPHPLSLAISLAAYWGNPTICEDIRSIRKEREWSDFLAAVDHPNLVWLDKS